MNFTQAVEAVSMAGVSGPVVFNADAGIYNEQFEIGPIAGASATNTVTFRPASADSVRIEFDPSQAKNYLVRFDGADYVHFEGLHFNSIVTSRVYWQTYSTVFFFSSEIEGLEIRDCSISGFKYLSSDTRYALLYAPAAAKMRNCLISGNSFYNGSYQVVLTGQDGNEPENVTISGNTFVDGSFRAIDVREHRNALIANNFITLANLGNINNSYGVYVYRSKATSLYHNSLHIASYIGDSWAPGAAMVIDGTSSDSIEVKNNIIVHANNAPALWLVNPDAVSESDYNVLLSTGQSLVRWQDTFYADLAAYQGNANGFDQNSLNLDPGYKLTTTGDLHTEAPFLDAAGTADLRVAVTTDFDGEDRAALTPVDIGADAYVTFREGEPNIAVVPSSLDFGRIFAGESDTLSLTVFNLGDVILSVSDMSTDQSEYIFDKQPFTVNPGEQRTLDIIFSPGESKLFTDNLKVSNNDPDTQVLSVPLRGEGFTLPDLQVSEVKAPPTASSGQTIQIDWVVKNLGNDGTKTPVWHDDIYLSAIDTLDLSTATFLGRVENFSALNAGEGYSNSATSTLPRGISGTHYIFVRTDIYNREQEVDEGNNLARSSAVQISLSPYPDLQVTAITVPPTVAAGDSMTISWTVQNNGTGRTDANEWHDTIFLSENDNLDFNFVRGDKIRINEPVLSIVQHSGALDASASYTASTKIRSPHTLSGIYYIFVYTDIQGGGSQPERGRVYEYNSETPNWYSDSLNFVISQAPDLVVTGASAPDSASLGEDITVQWTVENQGTGATIESSWQDRIWLSRSAVFDPDSVVSLSLFTRNGVLARDSSYTLNRSVRIPSSFIGTNYIFVQTDANSAVFEHTFEDNNILRDGQNGVPITIRNPNLVVGEVVPPPAANSGKSFEVSWTVRNIGTGAVFNHSWNDRVYLSRQLVFDPDSVNVLGSITHSGTLLPDSVYTARRSFTLPNGVSGDYYLFVDTDWSGRVFEPDGETDNRGGSATAMRVDLSPWPDLQVASVQSASNFTAGDRVPVTWTVQNNGVVAVESGSWNDRIYLSPGSTFDPGNATQLASASRNRALQPQASYTQSRTVTLAANLSGAYCIAVIADADDNVYEHTDEGNNLLHSEVIQISPYPPIDLVISGLNLPDSAQSGEVISLNWNVENSGQGATLESSWQDRVYLSADSILDHSADQVMADFSRSGSLQPGQSYQRDISHNLPNGFSGDFYVIVETDASGAVSDIDRSNNLVVSVMPLHIALAPSPDLTITSLSLPDSADAGQPLLVAYIVENHGDGALTGQNWYDTIYLSDNAALDFSDRVLATRQRNATLPPNSSYSDSIEVELPGFASGNFFLIAKTDSRDDIYEHNGEDNNIRIGDAASELPLVVKQPQPADLIVSDIVIPSNAVPGQEATIGFSLKNIGANRATGRLRSAIYISPDSLWEVADPLFGVLTHSIDLQPDSTADVSMQVNLAKAFRADDEGNVTEELPGLTPGSYHAIVRTNIRRNIRESTTNNNTLASTNKISTDVPQLQLGVPETGTLAGGEMRYYKLESVEAGATIQIDLTGSDSTAFNELYVALERTPTLNDFDFAAIDPHEASQNLLIPSSENGDYFLMLISRGAGSNNQFTLLADSLEFAIHSVETNVGGNTGQVTVKLTGAKFDSTLRVALKRSYEQHFAIKLYILDETQAFVTFDLTGISPNKYDLVAIKSDTIVTHKINAFEIVQGTAANFSTKILAPAFARAGRNIPIIIEFTHHGNIDIPIPKIYLYSLNYTPLAFTRKQLDMQLTNQFLYMELRELNAPIDVLRPGTSESLTIFAKAKSRLRFKLIKEMQNEY